jgi:hypothetical protein
MSKAMTYNWAQSCTVYSGNPANKQDSISIKGSNREGRVMFREWMNYGSTALARSVRVSAISAVGRRNLIYPMNYCDNCADSTETSVL